MLIYLLLTKRTLSLIIDGLALITNNNMLTIKKHSIPNISVANDAKFTFRQINLG
jgi:hypothetical protein